jgi:hypothetical protein
MCKGQDLERPQAEDGPSKWPNSDQCQIYHIHQDGLKYYQSVEWDHVTQNTDSMKRGIEICDRHRLTLMYVL